MMCVYACVCVCVNNDIDISYANKNAHSLVTSQAVECGILSGGTVRTLRAVSRFIQEATIRVVAQRVTRINTQARLLARVEVIPRAATIAIAHDVAVHAETGRQVRTRVEIGDGPSAQTTLTNLHAVVWRRD